MKKNLLAIFFLLFLMGCSELDSRERLLEKYKEEYLDFITEYSLSDTQKIHIPVQPNMRIEGKYGTRIEFDENSLHTINGEELGDSITIELIEVKTKYEMLFLNIPTTSDGQLLVSDGAFYINMVSEGLPLSIKEGHHINVLFPSTDSTTNMSLFYGSNQKGMLNWKLDSGPLQKEEVRQVDTLITQTIFIPDKNDPLFYTYDPTDSIITKKQLTETESIFFEFTIEKFAWINCDKFLNDPRPKTDLKVLRSINNPAMFSTCYLIFEDINSIMSDYWPYEEDKYTFEGIPVGEKVQLLCISLQDDSIYTFNKKLEVSENLTVTAEMEKVSNKEFKRLIAKMR